ncbi:Alpha-L-fucosidase [Planctomycetes bacterium CA13]|uniref:alpha-L-fucosidase n=1 Tax=Novipirellula herctigrandis TaxID=2527986 RepID=A0A5C5Z5G4_9BACT|nr:Alpha-L-fucosidase [Planctomycetes bacterium CA13]
MSPRIVIGIVVLLTLIGSLSRGSAQDIVSEQLVEQDDKSTVSPLPETAQQHDARMQWWREARFGMFVHWGLYSGLAGTWDGKPVATRGGMEWIQQRVKSDTDTYAKEAIPKFKPTADFARQWATLAKQAGCRYLVFTTKHHDGFGLFDSKAGDYNAGSVLNRDLVKEIVEACHAEGLKVGFYHSVIDWHHDQYTYNKSKQLPHPLRGQAYANGPRDHAKYQDYLHQQVTELVSNYGPVDVLWWDYSSLDFQGDQAWRSSELMELVRSKQPGIIMNNRLFRTPEAGWSGMGTAGFIPQLDSKYGDFITPEQHIPATGMPGIDWETCMTLNTTWGFSDHDHAWKSDETLIRNLIDIASKGGNYLLNIGPKGDGSVPEESIKSMRTIGKWMNTNGEAIYGTTASPFKNLPFEGRCTCKPGNLYFHVFDWPADGKLLVPMTNTIRKAYLLSAPDKALTVTSTENGQIISLPAKSSDQIATVVVTEIAGEPDVIVPSAQPILQSADGVLKLDATEAVLLGELRLERKHQHPNIGFWLHSADSVEWPIKISQAGKFAVTAGIAAEASGTFEIIVGDQKLRAKAPRTGGYDKFKNVTLGEINLATGKATLAIKAVKEGWRPFNLTTLTLTPVK